MTEQSIKDKPKASSLLHQPKPVFASQKLAGFADKAVFVDSSQSQTRDGFSFDVLGKSVLQSAYSATIPAQKYRDGHVRHPETPDRQPVTQERHPELVSGSTSNGRNERGTEIGTRYRYIDDTSLVPMAEAGKANSTNEASSAGGAKTRSRPNNEFVLYSYGEPVAMSADGNASYFGTDILGSVRSVTDKYGTVQSSYDYDAFGSPYLGNLENDVGFGYCGKSYDVGTGLYDYGFRDYSPNSARFTTVDPIRDGSNWFSYVVNDPVNYVDPFGLKSNDVKNYEYLGEWGGEKHYKAKPGATKWGLARDTGHDVKDVKGYDGDPTKMPIGTELSIPSNSGSTPSESTQITATPPSNAQTTVGTTNAVVTQPSAPAVPMTQSSAPAVSNGGKSAQCTTENKLNQEQKSIWNYLFDSPEITPYSYNLNFSPANNTTVFEQGQTKTTKALWFEGHVSDTSIVHTGGVAHLESRMGSKIFVSLIADVVDYQFIAEQKGFVFADKGGIHISVSTIPAGITGKIGFQLGGYEIVVGHGVAMGFGYEFELSNDALIIDATQIFRYIVEIRKLEN